MMKFIFVFSFLVLVQVNGHLNSLGEETGRIGYDQAIEICAAKHPEVPDEVLKFAERGDKVLNAAKENVTGVRCFLGCMLKLMEPRQFDANGEFTLSKLPNPPTDPKMIERREVCAKLLDVNPCDQMFKRINCMFDAMNKEKIEEYGTH